MPNYLSNYIDCWKRPSQLVVKNPDVPMIVFDENENDVASRKVKTLLEAEGRTAVARLLREQAASSPAIAACASLCRLARLRSAAVGMGPDGLGAP